MDKAELRKMIREKKRAMSTEEIVNKSRDLAEQLFAWEGYRNAGTIYGYLSYNQEVRTLPILEQALRDGKRVAVPKVFGDTMRFILMEDLTRVAKGYSGIPEPVDDGPEAEDLHSLVLMPGLAFDREGHRTGYGGGFYDRFLAEEPDHPTVALCYDFQMLPFVETNELDIPVQKVFWA